MQKFVIGLWVGAVLGFMIAALCQAAGRGREIDEMQKKEGEE